jgi:hypothetical protein
LNWLQTQTLWPPLPIDQLDQPVLPDLVDLADLVDLVVAQKLLD